MIKIFNTLSGKKESLPPPGKKTLKLFVCGPTVYDTPHLGHARTYIFFDAAARILRNLGFKLFYLQNITDVDDKIIARAREENKSPLQVARFYEKQYLKSMKRLGVNSVDHYARAADFIPEIVRQVRILVKKEFAYRLPDGYYFDVSRFPDYGRLARRTEAMAEDGVSRIDETLGKRNRADFALWKFPKAAASRAESRPAASAGGKIKMEIIGGEPVWFTEIGAGRPGWHIEDTAIAEKFFGLQYDLHGGGLDLKFPHHEAEIAEAEAVSGKKPFVKIWMHTGMLTSAGAKMSKSSGNFIAIDDFLKKHSPLVLRLIFIKTHYRSPVEYNEAVARESENALLGLKEFLAKLSLAEKNRRRARRKFNLKKFDAAFLRALLNDFNTPEALAQIFNLINSVQKSIWHLPGREAALIRKWIEGKLFVLGITVGPDKIPRKISRLAARRHLLRNNKQFIQADRLRKKIEALGYKIEDTPLGSVVISREPG